MLNRVGFFGKIGGIGGGIIASLRAIFNVNILTLTDTIQGQVAEAISVTGRTIEQYNGVLVPLGASEVHVQRGRRVENLTSSATDFTAWKNGTGATHTANSVTMIADKNSRIYKPFTFVSGDLVIQFKFPASEAGKVVRISLWASGLDGLTTGASPDITIPSSGFIQARYNGVTSVSNFGITNSTAGLAQTVQLEASGIVDVTGMQPSYVPEYVPNLGSGTAVQVFDTTSGNTVDANNIVTEAAGDPLHPSEIILGDKQYVSKEAWSAKAWPAGSECEHGGYWYSTVAGGTDVTFGSAVTWVQQGIYNRAFGALSEDIATNQFLQSDTPATQTITLSVGKHILWLDGISGDSITTAAGTAVGTGFGVADITADNGVDITTAGTVTYTVAGAPIRAQAEDGTYRTSYIPTTTTPLTRTEGLGAYKWLLAGSQIKTSGTFTLALGWVPSFGSNDLVSATRSILGFNTGSLGVLYQSLVVNITSYDGTGSVAIGQMAWSPSDCINYVITVNSTALAINDTPANTISLAVANMTRGEVYSSTNALYDGAFNAATYLQFLATLGGNNSAFRFLRQFDTCLSNADRNLIK